MPWRCKLCGATVRYKLCGVPYVVQITRFKIRGAIRVVVGGMEVPARNHACLRWATPGMPARTQTAHPNRNCATDKVKSTREKNGGRAGQLARVIARPFKYSLKLCCVSCVPQAIWCKLRCASKVLQLQPAQPAW
eukprot:3149621-Pyramimonas_sp.AAC.1